jgi:hypothetical protein
MRRRGVLLVVFIALLNLVSISPGHADLTTNLIGYWTFEESGADLSGGGRAVDLHGGASYGAGLFGKALSLPGDILSYAALPTNDTIYNFGDSNFTIQVWVKFNSLSGEQTLIEKFSGDEGPGWTLTKTTWATQFYAFPATTVNAGLPSDKNKWYHITAVR